MTARWPRKRRPSKRQQRQREQLLGLAVGGLAAFALLSALVSWLSANPWVLVLLGAVAVVATAWWAHRLQQQLL